jgi:predicted transcriptional regulator
MSDGETVSCPEELFRRSELLAALLDGPKTPSELESESSLSRSTVHRATASLTEQEVLAETDGAFALTGFGRAVAREIVECRRNIVTADRLRPLLDEVDLAEVTFPLDHLADARITRPTEAHTHVAVARIADLLADSERIRLFSGVVSPIYLDMAYEEVREGTEVVAIFDRQVVEILFCEYGDDAREAARTGRFEVLTDDSCPFELFLCDGTVGVAAHDEAGGLRLFLESDDDRVYEWAESLYGRVRERSEYVTLF